MSSDTQSTQTHLKALENTNAQLEKASALAQKLSSDIQGLAKSNNQMLKQAGNGVSNLTRQLKKATQAAKHLVVHMKSVQKVTATFGDTQLSIGNRLNKVHNSLNKVGDSFRKLNSYQKTLNGNLRNTTKTIDRQATQLAKLNQQRGHSGIDDSSKKNFKQKSKSAITISSGALLTAGTMMLPGLSFGEQMSSLQASAQLAKDDPRFQALKNQALDLGSTTRFTSTEVGLSQEALISGNFSPEAAHASMQDIVNLAAAHKLELSKSADIVAGIAGTFKIDAANQGNVTRITDILTTASIKAKVSVESLNDTIQHLGQAEGLNLSLEEAAAMAGVLGNMGIAGEEAGATMQAMLSSLSAPTEKARAQLAQLGLSFEDSSTGELRSIPDILADINAATEGMTNTQRASALSDIFSPEKGGTNLQAIAGIDRLIDSDGINKLHELFEQFGSKISTKEIADIKSNNAAGDLQILSAAWNNVGVVLSEVNDGPLRETLQMFTGMVQGVTNWMRENPKLAQTLTIIAASGAALVLVLGAIGFASGSIISGIGALHTAVPIVAGALKTLSLFLLTNPIGLFITAISTAVALIIYNWDSIGPKISEGWQWITNLFKNGLDNIIAFFTGFSFADLIFNSATADLDSRGTELNGKFKGIGSDALKGFFSGIISEIPASESLMSSIASAFSGLFADELEIRSPSRVFKRHGSNVMAGLEQGLDENKNTLKPMDTTVKRLKQAGAGIAMSTVAMNAPALDTRPPIQAASTSSAGNAAALHIGEIHVHAAPGMDEQALAHMVSAEIARLHATQTASQRSQLHDED